MCYGLENGNFQALQKPGFTLDEISSETLQTLFPYFSRIIGTTFQFTRMARKIVCFSKEKRDIFFLPCPGYMSGVYVRRYTHGRKHRAILLRNPEFFGPFW